METHFGNPRFRRINYTYPRLGRDIASWTPCLSSGSLDAFFSEFTSRPLELGSHSYALPARSDSRTRLQQRGERLGPSREEARSRARWRCLLGGWGSVEWAAERTGVGVRGPLRVREEENGARGPRRGNVSRYVTYGNWARSPSSQRWHVLYVGMHIPCADSRVTYTFLLPRR